MTVTHGFCLISQAKYTYPVRYNFFPVREEADREVARIRAGDLEHPEYRYVLVNVITAVQVDGVIFLKPLIEE